MTVPAEAQYLPWRNANHSTGLESKILSYDVSHIFFPPARPGIDVRALEMTHVFAARTVPEKRKPKRSIPCRGRDLFGAVNAALPSPRSCCEDWLPGGRANGEEYSVLNPTRSDRRVGSFKINLKTARWADFATDAKGGDLISLYAYLHGLRQIEAAQELADKFGVMS